MKKVSKINKNINKENMINNTIIFQGKDGGIEFKNDITKETIWASLDQIALVFGRNKSVISRHIKNIFTEGELEKNSVVAFFATTAADGKTYNVEYFNLDVILSVGYRVNGKVATEFRKWVSSVIKQYLIQGYTINKKRIQNNYDQFIKAVENIQSLLPEHIALDPKIVLDLVKEFATTFVSLDNYDKDNLTSIGKTKVKIKIASEELLEAVAILKKELIRKGEATELFAREKREGSLSGILGNVMQSLYNKDVYPTAEEKSANLLYFIIKNHPFDDGNKRVGAFTFLWFIRKSKIKNYRKITPETLTALALLIAESNPNKKDQMVALVTQLLK